MIDVEWNDNAKAAVNTYNDWALENDLGIHAFFEHLTNNGHIQPKTIADAVEYYNCEFPEGQAILGIAYSNNKITPYYAGSPIAYGTNSPESYIICTRAEFEAYVKEQESKQEGEKWTHTLDGRKCKIIINKPDVDEDIVVLCKEGDYQIVGHEALKPIKPTISEDAKRQLELYVQYRVDKYGDHAMKSDLSDYLSHHDII